MVCSIELHLIMMEELILGSGDFTQVPLFFFTFCKRLVVKVSSFHDTLSNIKLRQAPNFPVS